MKALTILQPYASAIIDGPKRVENRTWRPNLRTPVWIAVHAGLRPLRDHFATVKQVWRHDRDRGLCDVGPPETLKLGALLGAMRVYDFLLIDKHPGLDMDPWATGPWCWMIDQVVRWKPIPWKGRQGLWELPEEYSRTGHPEGTRVLLRYGERYRKAGAEHHLRMGVVRQSPGRRAARRNHVVELDCGSSIVVPAGHLKGIPSPPPRRQGGLFDG